MTSSNKDGIPLIVFIPIAICIAAIFFLLDLRQRRNNATQNEFINQHDQQQQELLNEYENNNLEEEEEEYDENDPGEGSSTAVRIKKVGKKRGEKLRRKEEMRQYREYMDQQRQIRKAQEEVYEAEFARKKLEESIRRTDEMEKRNKEREKKAKADEKEELKRQKTEEKEAKKRQARFDKYNGKLKKLVKEKKSSETSELAYAIGISEEEVIDILKTLCEMDAEFELCLWSGTDTFLFITKQDYEHFEKQVKEKGKISIHDVTL